MADQVFQLVAGHPALDFVNTLDYRFHHDRAKDFLISYNDLLGFCEQSNTLTSKQARHLRRFVNETLGARVLEQSIALREAIAEVLYARLEGRTSPPLALRSLERYFKTALLQRKLCSAEPCLEWQLAGEGQAELPLWALALSASHLMLSEAAQRVRECVNGECRWLFLDTSKNHTRRWCDMKLCGNRMKARRFKAQRKA